MKVIFSWCTALFLVSSLAHAQSVSVEKQVTHLLEHLTHSEEDGYSVLPDDTRLIAIKTRDNKATILLEISNAFLLNEFDEATHEEVVETMAGGLSEFNFTEIQLRAKNAQGAFVQLSSFLEETELPIPLAYTNSDPLPATRGIFKKKRKRLKNQAQPDGLLSGKTIWLSAGHGWQYHSRRGGVCTQRHNTHGVVEDFATAEFVNYHLLKYLYQAGANIWTVRERDMNTNEVIVDNDVRSKAYRESGRWQTSSSRGYKNKKYRYAISNTIETATATFTPAIPAEGLYWVSVYYVGGNNRTVDARYKIEHAGGVSEVHINQEVHGSTWVYLGQFYFDKGRKGKVTLSNQSSEKGQAVIADAVRFGGGIGDSKDCDQGQASGAPRFEEASKYYANFQGYPNCVNDVVIRPMYAEWELAKGSREEQKNAVYLSLHTNANGKGGTESYVHTYRHTANSRRLQSAIHDMLVSDLRKGWDRGWQDRGKKRADFGELRALRRMPGVLLELAFHDYVPDAKALTDPQFRQVAARAIYKGIVRYFSQQANQYPVFLPEPPSHIYASSQSSDKIKISWKAPLFGGPLGSKAKQYKIYKSLHGKAFAGGEYTSNTSFTFKGLKAATTYYFRVAAVNEGGESFPSAVVAVRTPEKGTKGANALIVDGFDRLDRGLSIVKKERLSKYGKAVNVRRVFLDQMNHYDYMAEHAKALALCQFSFDGATNEAVLQNDRRLADYQVINWYVGRESESDQTLSRREQAALSRYLDQGGNLIISGSEIAYDLDRKGNGRAFIEEYLKATYVNDDAGEMHFKGNPGRGLSQLSGQFSNHTYGLYPARSPDVIKAVRGGKVLLRYRNGQTAAVSYSGNYGLTYFAFPLETVAGDRLRGQLFDEALKFMNVQKKKQLLARIPKVVEEELVIQMPRIPEGRAELSFFNQAGQRIKAHQWQHYSRKKERIPIKDLPTDHYHYELVVLGQKQEGKISIE